MIVRISGDGEKIVCYGRKRETMIKWGLLKGMGKKKGRT